MNAPLDFATPELEELANEEDEAYENQAQLEREHECYEALEACVAAGVPKEHLKVLARETGMTTWALQQSLKGN